MKGNAMSEFTEHYRRAREYDGAIPDAGTSKEQLKNADYQDSQAA
jgi:hypothetical protein